MKILKNKSDAAFTLLEMIVVIGIIVLISALSFASYKEGQNQYVLQLSAQKLAADLRRAQNMALSTVVTNGGQISGGGYGIYFDKSQNKNLTYILFADIDNPPGQVVYDSGSDSTIEEIELKKGVEINTISLDGDNTYSNSYIIFTPPDPKVTIGTGSSTELRITVSLIKDSTRNRTVTINKFGKIDIID